MKNGWKHKELGDTLTLQRGFDLPHRMRREGQVPIVSSSGVSGWHNRAQVNPPGIVTGRYGTIGEVFYVEVPFWPLNTTLYVRDFKGNDPFFLSYLLRTIDFESHSGKSGVPGVNRNDLHKLFVQLPPLPEQRAIAAALSDVDELIGALDKLIAKKRAIKLATMQQLLTGKTRLPGFASGKDGYLETEIGELPSDWRVTRVKDITLRHKQGFYTTDSYVNAGTRLVRITDLHGSKIDYSSMPMLRISQSNVDQFKIERGDFLFARSGAIGRYGIVSDDSLAVFGSYIIRFVFDLEKISNQFFGYLYETEIVWKQLLSITQGSSNININAGNIKALKIPLPSVEEQIGISAVLADMDTEIAALEQRRDKTKAIKQGMMQSLLTGRVRLVEPEVEPC